MDNSSEVVSSIILSAYRGMEELKALYFCIFLLTYITIIAENIIIMRLICVEKSLHEPMYLFICNLAANGLYGGTTILPLIMTKLLSHTHEISLKFCLTQIFGLHTYVIVEFTILAVMSYDRYVAICYPLQYHSLMSLTRVYKLIAFSWFYPIAIFLLYYAFTTLSLQFCGKIVAKLYCVNYALIKLSCTNTFVINVIGLVLVIVYTFPQLIMIVYSYIHILRICLMSSRESKLKALRTCSPHLFAVLNYSVGCFFEIIQGRFDLSHLPFSTHVFLSLYFLIFPPILNPAIYSLSIQAMRKPIFKLFHCRKRWLTTK